MTNNCSLIENYLPIEEFRTEALRQEFQRKGGSCGLHPWWAPHPVLAGAIAACIELAQVRDKATREVLVKRREVKGRMRGQAVRLTTNEWYKAQQLAETYRPYVVWDPLDKTPELVRIQNPEARLDHAKREIVAARYFEIPAEAAEHAAKSMTWKA